MTWTSVTVLYEYRYVTKGNSSLYIELSQEDAKRFFKLRFGANPEEVTNPFFGNNFSFIGDYDSLEQATGFERHCRGTGDGYVEEQGPDITKYPALKYIPLDEWLEKNKHDVMVIRKEEITKFLKENGFKKGVIPLATGEWLKMGGRVCPLCQSDNLAYGTKTMSNLEARQHVECFNCCAEWHDTYRQTGYELLNKGE